MEMSPAELEKLIAVIMQRATNRDSHLHGEAHWKCVAWTGHDLCKSTPAANPHIVFLFGLLHDTQRLNDGHDPDHGPRAGALCRELGANQLRLSPADLNLLIDACDRHADGQTSDEPTLGVCWDADRLNLGRVNIVPDPRFLSTAAAKESGRIAQAEMFIGARKSWRAIYLAYQETCAMTRRTGPIALEYSSVGVAKLTFDSMRVVILFAIGVAISVVVATVYFEGAAARVEDWIAACALYAWGESAAVLLAIKIRGRIVELDPVGRPSWANVLGGIVYTLLLFVIIFNTTARRRFPLGLDKGGSFLVAVGLALLAAAAIAIVLTPRKRG